MICNIQRINNNKNPGSTGTLWRRRKKALTHKRRLWDKVACAAEKMENHILPEEGKSTVFFPGTGSRLPSSGTLVVFCGVDFPAIS